MQWKWWWWMTLGSNRRGWPYPSTMLTTPIWEKVSRVLFTVSNEILGNFFFAFLNIQFNQNYDFSRELSSPILVLLKGLTLQDWELQFSAIFTLIFIVLLIIFYNRIKPSYFLLSIILILTPSRGRSWRGHGYLPPCTYPITSYSSIDSPHIPYVSYAYYFSMFE